MRENRPSFIGRLDIASRWLDDDLEPILNLKFKLFSWSNEMRHRRDRGMAKVQAHSWKVTDAFWARVEPLVPRPTRDPNRQYQRRAGAGRPPKPAHLVFEGIMYVLRAGCQWKALPYERFGSASAIHRRFLEWERAGFPSVVAVYSGGVRRTGGDCLALAKYRRGNDESPASAGSRRSKPDGSGKKNGSKRHLPGTGVVSRCPSS